MKTKNDIAGLPFVAACLKNRFGRTRSFWSVASTGDDDRDYLMGQEMALQALACMAADPSGFNMLPMVGEDMSLTKTAEFAKCGFWSVIHLCAMTAFRAHGEHPVRQRQERDASLIARYDAAEAGRKAA